MEERWKGILKKGWKKPKIKHNKLTKWNWMVGSPKNFYLGRNTDIGAFTYINARYIVHIGDNVKIGAGCAIYSHNSIDNTKGMVTIMEGATIGAHSIILPGAFIDKNQYIKANSIVKKNEK
jgi:acetyltransferase-like isoleucine patch superfamily enzyme